jgi:hypothetical protein
VSRHAVVYLTVALLIVYGMVLPNAVTNSASAHNLSWNLVRDGHLRYFNKLSTSLPGGNFSSLIDLAEDEWDPHVGISISEVSRESDADVVLTSYCAPNQDKLGETWSAPTRAMRFNRCVLMHKCPDKNKACGVKNDRGKISKRKLRSTTSSRRARTFVHEFGHALGLRHPNDLTHGASVMSTIHHFSAGPGHPPIPLSNAASTVYDLRPHDIADIEDRWP